VIVFARIDDTFCEPPVSVEILLLIEFNVLVTIVEFIVTKFDVIFCAIIDDTFNVDATEMVFVVRDEICPDPPTIEEKNPLLNVIVHIFSDAPTIVEKYPVLNVTVLHVKDDVIILELTTFATLRVDPVIVEKYAAFI
jgi:hypothetical protein